MRTRLAAASLSSSGSEALRAHLPLRRCASYLASGRPGCEIARLEQRSTHEERRSEAQPDRNCVARPRVHRDGAAVALEVDARVVDAVPELGDHDAADLGVEPLDQALGEVVGVGARGSVVVEVGRDRLRLRQADPDRQPALAIGLDQDHDRGVGVAVEGEPLHAHRHLVVGGPCPEREAPVAARQAEHGEQGDEAAHRRPRRELSLPNAGRPRLGSLGLRRWSGRLDSNQRPLRPERSALPNCATPRQRRPEYCRFRPLRRPAVKRLPCGPPLLGRRPRLDAALFAGICAVAFAVTFLGVIARPVWFVSRPRPTLAALAAVTLLAAWPLVRLSPPGLALSIDPSTEPLLPAGDPARAVYEQAVRDFGDDEVFVIALETDDVFRRERLALLRRVTDEIAKLPEVRSVQSLSDVIAFHWNPEVESIDVGRFIDEIPQSEAELAALRARALADPLYQRALVSDDGRTAAVNVSFRKMTDKQFLDAKLEERIEAILAAESGADVRFHVAGRPHLKHAVYHGMLRDLRVLVPAALLVLALVLWVCFGTRRSVILPLGVVSVSLLWTYGAIAFLDRPLSILTTMLGPMLISVGCVYGVHVVGRYEEEAATAADPRAAALATLEHVRLPVLVSGATTLIGFGANLITDVPAVFELGAFSLLGVAAMTLLTAVGIPPLLALLPLRDASSRTRLAARLGELFDRRLIALSGFVAGHPGALVAAFTTLTIVSALMIPRIVIDTDYLSFFSPDKPVRRDFDAVNRLLSGAIPLYV